MLFTYYDLFFHEMCYLAALLMNTLLRLYRPLIPLLVMAVLCLWTLFSVLFDSLLPEAGHYAAGIAVVVNLGVFFWLRPWYRKVMLATLIAGVLNILVFTPYYSSIEFSITLFFTIGIALQPTSIFISVITLFLYQKEAKNIFNAWMEKFKEAEARQAAHQCLLK